MAESLPQAIKARRLRLSPVWLIPLLAALLSITLLGELWSGRGASIEIQFRDGEGLRAGVTPLKYRGVNVGRVSALSLSDDYRQVVASVKLNPGMEGLARSEAQFWIVRPEIGISGINALDTLISGPYIQLRPGSGARISEFIGLDKALGADVTTAGLAVSLKASRLGSLKAGAPVYYREVAVGSLVDSSLAQDASHVTIKLLINSEHALLLRQDSVFWNATGFDLKAGLFGMELRSQSLAAIMNGGVSFATPESYGAPAAAGSEFILYDKPKDEWLRWVAVIPRQAASQQKSTTPVGLSDLSKKKTSPAKGKADADNVDAQK